MTNTKLQPRPPTVYDVRKNLSKGALGGFVATSDQEINWAHTILLTVTPFLALMGLLFVRPKFETVIFTIVMYFWAGLGITGGYHRLWSHRAYSASFPVRLFLCIGGAAAFEGSAKWWCRNHRAHHRYTDTEKDPYNAKNGFWYSHMGWMLVKQNAKKIGYADISDLQKDPMINWQHKYYPYISIGAGIVFPTLFAGLVWGDYLGGYFYAAILKLVIVHHATFCVNSLAHWYGEKSFSDHHTAFDSVVTAVLTLGEGYHNYHHEFPADYRNGIRYFHYDPTKWFIGFLSLFGLTYDLKQIPEDEIKKARIQMAQRAVDHEAATFKFGKEFNKLPVMSFKEFKEKTAQGKSLVILDDIVHDVSSFVHEHPGGRQTLLNWVGTDVTRMFNGEDGSTHVHSKEARKFLGPIRVAKLNVE
jgi:stearoyl-CoA desaturase (delta-9 desaturase)